MACAAPLERPEVGPAPTVRVDRFLVSPTTGYREVVPADAADLLERSYRALMRGADPVDILVAAESLPRIKAR